MEHEILPICEKRITTIEIKTKELEKDHSKSETKQETIEKNFQETVVEFKSFVAVVSVQLRANIETLKEIASSVKNQQTDVDTLKNDYWFRKGKWWLLTATASVFIGLGSMIYGMAELYQLLSTIVDK